MSKKRKDMKKDKKTGQAVNQVNCNIKAHIYMDVIRLRLHACINVMSPPYFLQWWWGFPHQYHRPLPHNPDALFLLSYLHIYIYNIDMAPCHSNLLFSVIVIVENLTF